MKAIEVSTAHLEVLYSLLMLVAVGDVLMSSMARSHRRATYWHAHDGLLLNFDSGDHDCGIQRVV